MPPLVPARFLVRLAHPCPYVRAMPAADADADRLFELPEFARLRGFAALDGGPAFADVRLAWNELGVGIEASVTGKEQPPAGDASKPRLSDGLTLWLDTRDARAGHRATRTCHQFTFLPAGGGADLAEPACVQTKINRALQDAPLAGAADIPFRAHELKSGYRVEAFLPAAVLAGFDPDQHPRWGVYYHVRDSELGDQYLGVNGDFPVADDPSLWDALDLTGR